MESNLGTLHLSAHSMGIVYFSPLTYGSSSRINRIFFQLSDLPAIKSWTNPFDIYCRCRYGYHIPNPTIHKICLVAHTRCHYEFSFLSSLNSWFMLCYIDAGKDRSRKYNLCSTFHCPEWLVCRLDSSDWNSIERAIAARPVAVQ